jgi:hypothetical protein
MASPFPGMDPYLEDSNIWPGFHHRLADEVAAQLNPHIGPKYYADVNVRTVLEEVTINLPHPIYPDVGVFEQPLPEPTAEPLAVVIPPAPVQRLVALPGETKLRTVEVRLTETDELITAIEILSPYNKRRGEGLDEYRQKRVRLLQSSVHLIEIDLLQVGERPGHEVNAPPMEADYILLVNRYRGGAGRISDIWPVALNEALPLLPVPLLPSDADAPLDLNIAIRSIYTRAGYDWRLNYRRLVPPPELRPAMRDWISQNLAEVG